MSLRETLIPALLIVLAIAVPSFTSAATRPAVSSPFILGTANKVGTVNVLSLPEATGASASAVTRTLPFLVPNPRGFASAKQQAQQAGYIPPGVSEKKVVEVTDIPTPQVATVDLSRTGVSGKLPNPCACSPPDVSSAVGTSNVVEFVNTAGQIWDKSGNVVKSTFTLASFFLLPTTDFISDPTVLFDSVSGRWFTSIVDITTSRVYFAVSTSSDPTGTFVVYFVTAPAPDGGLLTVSVPDQPYIGTDDDKFGITANQFSCDDTLTSCFFDGTDFWIVNKSQLTAGSSASFAFFSPDPTLFTIRPARHLSSTTDFFLVSNCKDEAAPFNCVSSLNSETHSLQVEVVQGVPGVSTVTDTTFLLSGSIDTSTTPPNAIQPHTGIRLSTGDNRIESVVWRASTMWLTFTDSCVPVGDTATRSCGRLTQLTTSGISAAPTVIQDFDFSRKSRYVFYTAVSTDSNQNLVVPFGRSGTTENPSLRVTGRLATATPGTLQSSVLIIAGSKPDTSGRYGDYFSASTDPGSSPTITSSASFWVAGEFRVSGTFQSWSTEIAEVHLS